MENSEIKLLEQIKKDDSSAFDEIFRKYYSQLCFFSLKIVKSKEAAEEIVQDLFVQFWEKRKTLDINISLKAYLYRSVYNNSVRQFKSNNKFESINDSYNSVEDNFTDLLEKNEIENSVYNCIEELPEQCKKIFKMSRFEELKYREIAEKLNLSVKTVETQMSRALKYLTTNLKHLIKLILLIFSIFN